RSRDYDVFFLFSSRRRHTRSKRDWSSTCALPISVRERYGLLPLLEALRQIHLPQTLESAELARETMRFHEAFVLQAALARRRLWADSFEAVPRAHVDGCLLDQLDAALPFTLTEDR